MELTSNEKNIIKKQIDDMLEYNGGKSWYFQKDDIVIRVADHLPNFTNFDIYNEDCKKIVLISAHVDENQLIEIAEENENDYDEIVCIFIDNNYITSENFNQLPDFKFL